MDINVWVCAYKYRCPQSSKEDIRSSVVINCSMWMMRIEIGTLARAVHSLKANLSLQHPHNLVTKRPKMFLAHKSNSKGNEHSLRGERKLEMNKRA